MKKISFLLFGILIIAFALSASSEETLKAADEANKENTETSQEQQELPIGDEETVNTKNADAPELTMEEIFQKYDPEGNNKVKVEDYASLLKEVMKSSMSDGKKLEPFILTVIDTAIEFYVKDKNLGSTSFITYEEILEDIQSEKILSLVREYVTDYLSTLKKEEL